MPHKHFKHVSLDYESVSVKIVSLHSLYIISVAFNVMQSL